MIGAPWETLQEAGENFWVGHGSKRYTRRAVWDRAHARRSAALALAHEWRAAALLDGWEAKPFGVSPIEHQCLLTREGFSILIRTYPIPPAGSDEHIPSPWMEITAPNGADVVPPLVYSWGAILAASRTCSCCRNTDLDTKCYRLQRLMCQECGEAYEKTFPRRWGAGV